MFSKDTNLNKAREHSLLTSARPPYVTILTLVRDAASRLPNGEGTRAEVSQDSQTLIFLTIRNLKNQNKFMLNEKLISSLEFCNWNWNFRM